MPDMIASTGFEYAGRALRAGDAFTATDTDARLLHAAGRAVEDRIAAPVPPMTTENNGALVPVRRGRYGTRDLRAEVQSPVVLDRN